MRVVSADGREVIVVDEELTTAKGNGIPSLLDAQHLNLSFNALTTLEGLEKATNLRNLNLSHNQFRSLDGIERFTQLRILRCSFNEIKTLHWVAPLIQLQELWVNENEIETTELTHLVSLPALQTLILHPNPCTNAVNYVSHVVKTVPWIARVDAVVVDDSMRENAQHTDDRMGLSSAATEVSEISLMTSRSEEDSPRTKNESEWTMPDPPANGEIAIPVKTTEVEPPRKFKKPPKMSAEDFMRAFPVQDFIPMSAEGTITTENRDQVELSDGTNIIPLSAEKRKIDPRSSDDNAPPSVEVQQSDIADVIEDCPPILSSDKSSSSISAIASAVLSLPIFDGDSILKKKTQSSISKTKTQKKVKQPAANKPQQPDPVLASFQQTEWSLMYPNSAVTAILIRPDGSALAKWPNGSVAVSIDREREGFRAYATHKDGTIGLSFDSDGVGFINYYPSGRMMISTSSSGDGLYFSADGSSILRTWDSSLNMKDDKWEPTELLGDEPDGSLLAKLSESLGIRLQLHRPAEGTNKGRACPFRLDIFFASNAIRHRFTNWININEANPNDCDVVFGKIPEKAKKKASDSPPRAHVDILQDIRAAVANLT
ncbi:hypothetical protein Poli38472_002726 [Pythium oligandrum]|uniref:Uncharacterized protein n=1 Tax=Pythium oligandrum TaxID=41045 RepID=A0A8K1CJE0_PYTOL|nr:hypothetical protein Poli38472_002726 [Pythium oligandrum]|eukprot:TMW63785.1 hypothetical protein Poli38472_002726 [Pythium oligandrum]